MKNYTITFKVTDIAGNYGDPLTLEVYLKDLLVNSTFPALGLEIVPLSVYVKNSRKN